MKITKRLPCSICGNYVCEHLYTKTHIQKLKSAYVKRRINFDPTFGEFTKAMDRLPLIILKDINNEK